MAVYESVTRALRNAGIAYKGENTLRGSVVSWLSDDANKEFFNTLIALPEYRGLGCFAGKSADDIINSLKNPNASVDALMGDIFSLAERRGITALTTNMAELIGWLTDIIDQNGLKAIILVWDEFSAYFKKNRASLDEFQKLAELSNHKPFYLMIVTHMSGSIFSEADQTGKIVRDRFVRKDIELPDSIAFELICYALKVKDSQKDIWNTLADDLNSRMPFSREAVRNTVWKGSTAGGDVLKGILPLHPLAALLLKNISSAFASNQRSMFNFIKNAETENLQAFQWFINTHSPDNGDLLSIDLLWDFFYEKGTDEYGTGAGRSNLDSSIRTTLDTYTNNEGRLFSDEKRVLKIVLMMQAISEKLGDSVDLFRPTDQNINYAFEGTDLEQNRAVTLVKKLVKEDILYEKPMGGGKTQYAAAAVSGDQAQIDGFKKQIVDDTKTASLVSSGELESALPLSKEALRFRYEVTPVTVDNFTSTINKVTNERTAYKFRAVLSFARNDEERNKIRELIKAAVKEDRYNDLVFIDASYTVMGGERFEQWVDFAANERYWRPKDKKLGDEMSRKANGILTDWKADVENGTFAVYSVFSKTGEPCANAASALAALSNIVIQKYPLSFDNAKSTENWWKKTQQNDSAKRGINQNFGGVIQGKEGAPLMHGAWQIDKYWEAAPALPVSKLKLEIDELINADFKNDGRIAVGKIFDWLIGKGFMPCNIYAFLTGFLLKEYASGVYRYSDGETGEKMSAEKLAEIIGEYINHKNAPIARYREKFIEVMTPEHMDFLDFAKSAFRISDSLSVEQTAIRIRSKLKDIGYPIWCFKKIDANGLDGFIDKLAAIANPDNSGESVTKTAAALGRMALQIPTAAENLAALFYTEGNAKQAIEEFLAVFENGDIPRLADEISVSDVLLDVKRQVGSGEALWLWDQETGEDELRKLLTDYKIVAASNRINTKTSSFAACVREWQDKTKSIRIPCSALLTETPVFKKLFEYINDIAVTGELTYDKRSSFLNELEKNVSAFTDFFSTRAAVFKEIYSFHLTGFSENEVNALYSKLPMNSFTSDKSDFEKTVAELAGQIRVEQEKYKLHQLWEDRTSSKTPRDWSAKNRTPVLSLVPAPLQGEARRAFGAINRNNPEDADVKFALEFIQNKASFLSDLNDNAKVSAAFVRDIIGRYAVVLPDADEVRARLESVITTLPYDWCGDPAVRSEVEKFARSRYNQGGSEKVLQRIEKMDAGKAKEYLKRLIKDNMNVGIEIISEGGDEA